MGTGSSFPRGKVAGRVAASDEVKNAWRYTSTPPIRLHGVVLSEAQGKLNFYLLFGGRNPRIGLDLSVLLFLRSGVLNLNVNFSNISKYTGMSGHSPNLCEVYRYSE
jgi:hypothetical protein